MTPFSLQPADPKQKSSARRLVADQLEQLSHLGEAEVLVGVGVTPHPQPGQPAMPQLAVHFCSSGFQLIRMLRPGDGIPIRQDDNYEVEIKNGLWLPKKPSFAFYRAHIRANGKLVLTTNISAPARLLEVPRDLLDDAPWAYAEGRNQMADAYGVRTLDEAAERFGQLVTA